MRLLAPAKINLVLEVMGSRPDGYHEIRTVLQTIDLVDRLEVGPADHLRFTCDDPSLPAGEENLVVRAARLLARAAGVEARAALHLEKTIPFASGLGGGSSDAATALLGLASLWGLSPGQVDLLELAAALGSDVPFFLRGGTALALGRGELVFPLEDLPPCHLVLARPAAGLSTTEVYHAHRSRLTGGPEGSTMSRFVRHLFSEGEDYGFVLNDLEVAATGFIPEIGFLVRALRDLGARAAALSGSGSVVFGLYTEEPDAHRARKALDRHPAADRTWLCRTLDAPACARGRPRRPMGGGSRHGHH